MWTTKASATSSATPASLWALWQDVDNWKDWDDSLAASTLSGEFGAGSTGTLQPKGAPHALPFTLLEVIPLKSFSNESALPGATLHFAHQLEQTESGTLVTHQITISGPAWQDYATRMGAELERGLPQTVAALARLAEQRQAR